MISPKSHPLGKALLLLILLFSSFQLRSQCNPPDQLPTLDCADAPLVCLLDACYETLNLPFNCCNGWCGANTAIHNPQYFQFIPTCDPVEIHIHVDFCTGGNGLQSALLNSCPWDNSDVIDCDPGTPPGGTMVLIGTGLVIGQVYWLVIDGSNGALCEYTIDFTQCIESPGITEELTSAEAIPGSVCQGYNGLILNADPPIANAHGYYWVLGWSGDTITSTLNFTTLDVPANVDPGTYEICVRAFSGCDTTDNEICFDVEVYEILPEDKDPAIFCPEDFPFNWGPLPIPGAGEYTRTFTDADGCVFDSTWVVDEYPEPDLGQLDTLYCLPTVDDCFTYEGEDYCLGDTYDLMYPNGDVNGCDSMAELNLTLLGVSASIELTCDNGEFVLTVYPETVIPNNADLDFLWYEQGSNILLFEGSPFLTLQGGCYDLYINVSVPEGSCLYFIETFCFNADDYYPPPPDLANGDTLLCAQPGVFFYVIEDPFGEIGLEYVWSSSVGMPIFQFGDPQVEMDFSNVTEAEICVYAIGECGAGQPSCFNVEIIPTPVADFTVDIDVCDNTATTVTFTGSASATAEFIWDFGGANVISGSGVGPYVIEWSLSGNKVVELQVIEPGCDTALHSEIVTVTSFQAPVINCNSTINSIAFDWDDVAGASGYLVSLNGGPNTPVSSSDTTVTGLTPGTMVQLILTVVSGGPCPNIIDTLLCTAQDCPPPTIVLAGQDSACLNNPSIITLTALVNGNPGTGTWSGPGIIDPINGLFNPKVATAGIQQVQYTVDVNGCPFNAPYTITVFDSITADFTLDPLICISDAANLQYTGNASGNAVFTYTFGTANILAGSGAGPYQLGWNTPGQKTVRLQISENGCTSDVITQNTNVVSTLVAPVVPCAPNTSGMTFSWTLDPAATDSTITVLTGQTGTQAGNTYTFGGLTAGDTVRLEIVTISNGPCPSRRDTFECVARPCPPVMLNVTPVNDICLYPGTGNVQLQVTVTNGNGSGDWSGTGVIDMVNGRFSPVVAGAGSHLITYHYSDDGCDFFETITINVYDIPDAFISNTDLTLTCTSGSIILDGTGSTGAPLNYTWTTSLGAINGATNTATAEAIAQGVYQLLVSNATSGCKDSVSVTIDQDDNIPTADAGPDKTLTCDSTIFTLGGVSTSGMDIIYTWTTMGGNFTGSTNGMKANADKVGLYTLTVRDTVTGCQAQDNANISIDTAVASISLTPGDTIDCNTVLSSATSSLNEPVTDYNFSWSTADGLISGPTTGQKIDVSQGGTYTLTIHNKRNGCETSEDVFVPESDEIIDDVDVTETDITCFGDHNGSLVVNSVAGGAPPYTYSWSVSPNGGTSLTSLAPGTYDLTVTDQNGCSFSEVFTITEPPLVTLDIGPNLTVAAGDSVRIDLSTNIPANSIGAINWGGYDGILCPGCPSFQFIASTSATISATISDTAGCTAIDSMRLTVLVPRIIFIPNIFSPNGDGNNDKFTISGRFNLINIAAMRIYDRWGNQLFERLNMTPGDESQGWDGTFNNEPMQPGVYVFVAELDYEDISETVTGNITLLR